MYNIFNLYNYNYGFEMKCMLFVSIVHTETKTFIKYIITTIKLVL